MQQRTATLLSVKQDTPSTKIFRFKVDPMPEFIPGQFITLLIEKEGELYRRPYSIASEPWQKDYIEFAIKLYEKGAITPLLFALEEGFSCPCIGPFGRFTYEDDEKLPVFIAAGSGIAPFLGMTRHALKQGHEPTLLYSNKNPEEVIYADEFDEINSNNEDFSYVQTFTQTAPQNWQGENGRIDVAMIKKHLMSFSDSFYYLCGPHAFVTACHEILVSEGIDPARIKREEYE